MNYPNYGGPLNTGSPPGGYIPPPTAFNPPEQYQSPGQSSPLAYVPPVNVTSKQ